MFFWLGLLLIIVKNSLNQNNLILIYITPYPHLCRNVDFSTNIPMWNSDLISRAYWTLLQDSAVMYLWPQTLIAAWFALTAPLSVVRVLCFRPEAAFRCIKPVVRVNQKDNCQSSQTTIQSLCVAQELYSSSTKSVHCVPIQWHRCDANCRTNFPFFTFILLPANSWRWRLFERVTHESTLSAALLLDTGLNLWCGIYAKEGLYESTLVARVRALNGRFDDSSSSSLCHSLCRWVGVGGERSQSRPTWLIVSEITAVDNKTSDALEYTWSLINQRRVACLRHWVGTKGWLEQQAQMSMLGPTMPQKFVWWCTDAAKQNLTVTFPSIVSCSCFFF